jgi:hypothetical protein
MNERVGPVFRTAFDRLIDYAGMFPPAQLSLEEALAGYSSAQSGSAAWMLGRFIVPASRLSELANLWAARRAPAALAVSAIVDASLEPRLWFASLQTALQDLSRFTRDAPTLRIESLEIPLPPLLSSRETFDAPTGQLRASLDRAGLQDVAAFVELPRGARWRELLDGAMSALARMRLSAKVRCGGSDASAFPSVGDVAAFVAAAATNHVAFKATAGLHHPVRHRDAASGFVMHGFLNLLAAATFAPRVAAEQLASIVAEEDPRAFAFDDVSLRWRNRSADAGEVERMRTSAFTGYGSCSFSEPVEDLTALGLLPAAAA